MRSRCPWRGRAPTLRPATTWRCVCLVPAALGLLLTGCGSDAPAARIASDGASTVALTAEQSGVVEAGLKEMTGDSVAASAGRPVAMTLEGQPGVHVCGHVKKGGETFPYYVELRDSDGKPVAERGQVGSDEAKRAKVTFMCRRHGSG